MGDMFRRYGRAATLIICLLTAFWLAMLVVLPNITLLESSFRPLLPVTEIGGPADQYTLANYLKVFNGSIDTTLMGIPVNIPVHVLTFSLTIFYSLLVTILCFLLTYPLAYYMAKILNPTQPADDLFAALCAAVGVRGAARLCLVDHPCAERPAFDAAGDAACDRQAGALDFGL